ncbi:hypothetical protein [Flavobacterium sp. 22076]|uniref:hypothetical protein n=1 Tax=unclassified Flavobacterium TaxID=196869 RepID=UPI003F84F71C
MDILKFISVLLLLFFFSCKRITYTKKEDSFYGIHLKEWNSSICPKKVIYERYQKKSNFLKKIKTDSNFEVRDCDSLYKPSNQRVFIPSVKFTGQIDYDIRLVIDDRIEYKITSIDNKIDTVFYGGHPGDLTIMNNIRSLVVNGYKLDNSNTPLNIFIPTNLGKVIKKDKNKY